MSLFTQISFRGYADDADWSGGGPTPKAALNTGWVQTIGEKFRVRFALKEHAPQAQLAAQFYVSARVNAGSWFEVYTDTSYVRSATSTHYSDDYIDGSQRLGSESPFDGSLFNFDALIGDAYDIDFSAGGTWEFECGLILVEGDVNPGDVIELRLVEA